jgi:hypothetical protein
MAIREERVLVVLRLVGLGHRVRSDDDLAAQPYGAGINELIAARGVGGRPAEESPSCVLLLFLAPLAFSSSGAAPGGHWKGVLVLDLAEAAFLLDREDRDGT